MEFNTLSDAQEAFLKLHAEHAQSVSDKAEIESKAKELSDKIELESVAKVELEKKLTDSESNVKRLESELSQAKQDAINAASSAGVPPIGAESFKKLDDKQVIEQFNAISDPISKHEFYIANRAILNPFKR